MVSLRLVLSSFPQPSWRRGNAKSSWAMASAIGIAAGVGLSISLQMANSGNSSLFKSSSSPFWASLSLTNAPGGALVEPKTGVEFPATLDGGRRLVGVGLRRKCLFGLKNIDVYAFGVYADEEDVKRIGEKYKNLTVSQLKESKDFQAEIMEQDISMTVRLQIVYSRLSIRSVRNAFEESVGNRLRMFSDGTDTEELLKRFTSLFKDEYKIPRGSTIDLSREPGQVLHAKINGEEIGVIQSKLLCRSIFDLYIGNKPFDQQAKQDVDLHLAELVQSS
ncbi:chalcone-flavanone isomerase family protein [Wolffia australiana]